VIEWLSDWKRGNGILVILDHEDKISAPFETQVTASLSADFADISSPLRFRFPNICLYFVLVEHKSYNILCSQLFWAARWGKFSLILLHLAENWTWTKLKSLRCFGNNPCEMKISRKSAIDHRVLATLDTSLSFSLSFSLSLSLSLSLSFSLSVYLLLRRNRSIRVMTSSYFAMTLVINYRWGDFERDEVTLNIDNLYEFWRHTLHAMYIISRHNAYQRSRWRCTKMIMRYLGNETIDIVIDIDITYKR